MDRRHHDSFFKYVFGKTEHAEGAFRAWLPLRTKSALDFATLENKTSELIGADLSLRHCDLLFEAKLAAGRGATLALLHEHQSAREADLPVRAFVYAGRVAGNWLRDKSSQHPPAVLCLVLHQGPGEWRGANDLAELYGLPDDVRAELGSHVPGFRLMVVDLASEDDAELKSLDATPLARLAWLMLKHAAQGEDLAACLRSWPELVRPLEESAEDTEAVASYALRAGDAPRDELAQTLQELAGPRSREVVMTTAEKLHQEGRQEGRREGQQHLLLRQLRARFAAAITAEIETRVREAEQAELDAWADRVLAASSLDEIFTTQ